MISHGILPVFPLYFAKFVPVFFFAGIEKLIISFKSLLFFLPFPQNVVNCQNLSREIVM